MGLLDRKFSRRGVITAAAATAPVLVVAPEIVAEEARRIWALGGVSGFNDQPALTHVPTFEHIGDEVRWSGGVFTEGLPGVGDAPAAHAIWWSRMATTLGAQQFVIDQPGDFIQGDRLLIDGRDYVVTDASPTDRFWVEAIERERIRVLVFGKGDRNAIL